MPPETRIHCRIADFPGHLFVPPVHTSWPGPRSGKSIRDKSPARPRTIPASRQVLDSSCFLDPLLPFLDRTAARLGAAGARSHLAKVGKIIVDRQFLAGLNFAQAHVEDVTPHHAADQVRLAAMVDD